MVWVYAAHTFIYWHHPHTLHIHTIHLHSICVCIVCEQVVWVYDTTHIHISTPHTHTPYAHNSLTLWIGCVECVCVGLCVCRCCRCMPCQYYTYYIHISQKNTPHYEHILSRWGAYAPHLLSICSQCGVFFFMCVCNMLVLVHVQMCISYIVCYIYTFRIYGMHVMGWLRLVGSISQVSFAEKRLFYRALLQERPIISSILLTAATSYMHVTFHICGMLVTFMLHCIYMEYVLLVYLINIQSMGVYVTCIPHIWNTYTHLQMYM